MPIRRVDGFSQGVPKVARSGPRRPVWILLLVCLWAARGCGGEPPSETPPKWNLLLVTLDTLRADHLGCYGYDKNTSPSIDALAGESVLFERAVSQSAVTPVSHASILTGLNPYHHGLRSLHGGANHRLPEERLTLAERLRAKGYQTAGFVSAFPVTRHYGLEQGFETWDQEFDGDEGKGVIAPDGIVTTSRAQRRGDETTARAIEWLNRKRRDPFFAWVHYFDVHDPVLRPPDEYVALFPPASSKRPDALRALYDAELRFVDDQIGRLLKTLEGIGERGHTVVALVADHGEGLGDHDWWGHAILYEEQVRVPFLLHMPGRAEARRVSATVRTVDLVPTLVELLDAAPARDRDFDGESLLDLIEGRDHASRITYSESINDLRAYRGSELVNESLYAVSDGRWKLIAHREASAFKAFELFDLRKDPEERTDVHAWNPAATERLTRYLEELRAFLDEAPRPTTDPETREKLEALGYLE